MESMYTVIKLLTTTVPSNNYYNLSLSSMNLKSIKGESSSLGSWSKLLSTHCCVAPNTPSIQFYVATFPFWDVPKCFSLL